MSRTRSAALSALTLAAALPLAACFRLPGWPEETRAEAPKAGETAPRERADARETETATAGATREADPAPREEQAPRGGIAAVADRMRSAAPAAPQFHPFPIVDRQQGGLTVGTLAVPAGWRATSSVSWNYSDVSWPVRMAARVTSPDGTAWIETYPAELFYWLEPYPETSVAVGGRALGMVHRPNIGAEEALQRYVVSRYRGQARDLKITGLRRVGNIPQMLGKPAIPGDSVAARVHYTIGGRPVDEEFFCLLTQRQRIPYTGPQGTTYENHRLLAYAFSMGAADGRLGEATRLLGFIASSFRIDPIWDRHREQIQNRLHAQFNANIAAGYQKIAAAGALSRQISANNDAMLASIDAQRVASNRASSSWSSSTSSGFDDYIRGTERTQDPYWGTSEHSYNEKYHWTDGQGSYQSSNDAGFNPNVGSSQNWTLMEPAK